MAMCMARTPRADWTVLRYHTEPIAGKHCFISKPYDFLLLSLAAGFRNHTEGTNVNARILLAAAVDAPFVHSHQSTPTETPASIPTARQAGQLRETFENDLVLGYLDLAEALAARFEARGRERADLNQVAYLGLVKAARGFDQVQGRELSRLRRPHHHRGAEEVPA